MQKLVIITWKSGCWKTTFVEELLKYYNIPRAINYTSRKKRNDQDNDYEFFTQDEMIEKFKNDELLEFVKYNGEYYWIPKPKQDLTIVILEPTWAAQAMKYCFDHRIVILSIYLECRLDTLEKRMKKRWDKEEEIDKRLCLDMYMVNFKKMYKKIVNVDEDDVKDSVDSLIEVINDFIRLIDNNRG